MTQGLSAPANSKLRGAIVASLALTTTACGGTGNLWQGDEVLVEARQTTLERNVVDVSEDNRELKDRFNALERLYVDLARAIRDQQQQVSSVEHKMAMLTKDPETETAIRRVRNDISGVRADMKALENRIFSVEMTDRPVTYRKEMQPAASQPAATSTPTSSNNSGAAPAQAIQAKAVPAAAQDDTASAPTGNSQQGADVQTGTLGTPVAQTVQNDGKTYYGVHLASYRSKDQVSSGWSSLYRAFSAQLQDLKPLIYVQSQEGIGTFLRLIVGPLEREADAELLCENIRAIGGEQYCRVSEYQGDPVE